MTQILMGMMVWATVAAPDDLVEVSARIAADRLVVGESYEIVIDLSLKDGYSASGAGVPAPLLQIEVPSCVVLKGKVLRGHRELARNEYLQEPFERRLSELPARIGFDLNVSPVRCNRQEKQQGRQQRYESKSHPQDEKPFQKAR